MRTLITGASGFVGGHLVRYLQDALPHHELHGTCLTDTPSAGNITLHTIDLKDPGSVYQLIKNVRPECIYHLAAQAFVPTSFAAPWETLENNIRGQLNIFQVCLQLNLYPTILIISSAEIYGIVAPHELPLTENAALRPNNPYSVSKVAQDMLGLQYFLSHDLPILRARPFNHFGPGQSTNFVAPAFASQISRIESGEQPPVIEVGDLSSKRDFTDVRDIVRAYHLIMEKGTPGEAYNIASGKALSIQYLLDTMIETSGLSIEVVVDEKRLRKADTPISQGDYTKLANQTGWRPHIPFEQSIADILQDCRQRVHQ